MGFQLGCLELDVETYYQTKIAHKNKNRNPIKTHKLDKIQTVKI
jgi:hypothetical protein